MITAEFAEKLYIRINEHSASSFDASEIETLSKLVSSDVMLKAFGRAIAFAKDTEKEMAGINMSTPGASIDFTRAQGQIQGINSMIAGILGLITIKDDEDDES